MASGSGPRRRPGRGPGPPAPAGAVAGRCPADAGRQGAEGCRVVPTVGDRPGPGFATERRGSGRAAHRHAESFPAGLLGELRIGVAAQPGSGGGTRPSAISVRRWRCGPIPVQPTTAWARSCTPWAEWTRRSTPWSKLSGSTPGICWPTTTSPSLSTPRVGSTSAIDHFQQALSIDPESAALHNNLGMALRARGRLDEAIEHLRESVSINPNSTSRPAQSWRALHDKGREDEALEPRAASPFASTPNTPSPTVIWPFFCAQGPTGGSH